MKKLLKNQRGAIDIILILVFIVLAAGLGGYVYYQQTQAQKSYDQSGKGVTVAKKVDPYASWKNFSSVSGKFSLKYPSSWKEQICDNNDGVVYLAPNQASAAVCNSEAVGEMMVFQETGDNSANEKFTASAVSNITTKDITVDGVKGIVQTGTDAVSGMGQEAGAKEIRYIFVKGGNTYVALYAQHKGMPDVSAEFNSMISKTLKFN